MPRKPQVSSAALTRERIAEDIADFERAGGRVEILGTTRVLKTTPPVDPATATTTPATSGKPAKSSP